MKPYIEWTKEELVAEKARLEQEFADVKAEVEKLLNVFKFRDAQKEAMNLALSLIHI